MIGTGAGSCGSGSARWYRGVLFVRWRGRVRGECREGTSGITEVRWWTDGGGEVRGEGASRGIEARG